MKLEQLFPSFWEQTPAFLKVALNEFLPKLTIFSETEGDVVDNGSSFEYNRRKLRSKYIISEFKVAVRVSKKEVIHVPVFGFTKWARFFKKLGDRRRRNDADMDVRWRLFIGLSPFVETIYRNCSVFFGVYGIYKIGTILSDNNAHRRFFHRNCHMTIALCQISYTRSRETWVKFLPDLPPGPRPIERELYKKRRLLGRPHWERYLYRGMW